MRYQFPPELAEKVRRHMESGRFRSEAELLEDALKAYDAMGDWLDEWKVDVERRIEEAADDEARPLDVEAMMTRVRARLAPTDNGA